MRCDGVVERARVPDNALFATAFETIQMQNAQGATRKSLRFCRALRKNVKTSEFEFHDKC